MLTFSSYLFPPVCHFINVWILCSYQGCWLVAGSELCMCFKCMKLINRNIWGIPAGHPAGSSSWKSAIPSQTVYRKSHDCIDFYVTESLWPHHYTHIHGNKHINISVRQADFFFYFWLLKEQDMRWSNAVSLQLQSVTTPEGIKTQLKAVKLMTHTRGPIDPFHCHFCCQESGIWLSFQFYSLNN